MNDWMGTIKNNNSAQNLNSANLTCDVENNNFVNNLLNQPSFLENKNDSKTLSPISLQQELSRQNEQQKIQQQQRHHQQQQQQINFLVAVAAVAAVRSPINTNSSTLNSIDSNSALLLLQNNDQSPQSSVLNYSLQQQLNTKVAQQSCNSVTTHQNFLQQQSQDTNKCETLPNFALTSSSNSDYFLSKDFTNNNKLKDFENKGSNFLSIF